MINYFAIVSYAKWLLFTTKLMLVTKLPTSFQQICQDRLFSGSPYMTLFNFGAIRYASGNAIHISPEVIEFGTVGIKTFEE